MAGRNDGEGAGAPWETRADGTHLALVISVVAASGAEGVNVDEHEFRANQVGSVAAMRSAVQFPAK